MEPPALPKQKTLSEGEVFLLLKRISSLPVELALPILYNLDYDSLIAVCNGAKRAKLPKLQSLSFFCSDVNFWRDYLLENGYDLPEGLPILIKILKRQGQTDLDVLKALFFSGLKELRTYEIGLAQTLKEDITWHKHLNITQAQLEQAALDFDYLDKQIRNHYHRAVNENSIFVIEIFIPEVTELNLPKQIKLDNLIQWLVDHDLSNIPEGWSTSLMSTWVDSLFASRVFWVDPSFPLYDFHKRLEEQDLAMLPLLVREGDIIVIQARYFDKPDDFGPQWFYYVGPKDMLHYFSDNEADLYLPEVARPFLEKHQIESWEQINDRYSNPSGIDIISLLPIGYTKGTEKISFPEEE